MQPPGTIRFRAPHIGVAKVGQLDDAIALSVQVARQWDGHSVSACHGCTLRAVIFAPRFHDFGHSSADYGVGHVRPYDRK
jgi:hypothetical protein